MNVNDYFKGWNNNLKSRVWNLFLYRYLLHECEFLAHFHLDYLVVCCIDIINTTLSNVSHHFELCSSNKEK